MGIGFISINNNMQKYLIKDIQVVNEGRIINADVLITNGRIEKLASQIAHVNSIALK
jgi:dihydroorotase